MSLIEIRDLHEGSGGTGQPGCRVADRSPQLIRARFGYFDVQLVVETGCRLAFGAGGYLDGVSPIFAGDDPVVEVVRRYDDVQHRAAAPVPCLLKAEIVPVDGDESSQDRPPPPAFAAGDAEYSG